MSEPLPGYRLSDNDIAFINMMSGATFGPDVSIQLPSGKHITGAEMTQWIEHIRKS